jgi:hypothetical protein
MSTTPIFILGGHQTDFAKAGSRSGQDLSDMIREATLGALADARIAGDRYPSGSWPARPAGIQMVRTPGPIP